MMGYSLILLGILVVYFLLWRLYLFVAPKLMPEDWPNFFREPKFWQFFLIVFAIGTTRKKLDI